LIREGRFRHIFGDGLRLAFLAGGEYLGEKGTTNFTMDFLGVDFFGVLNNTNDDDDDDGISEFLEV
jgi:hypothetical protein